MLEFVLKQWSKERLHTLMPGIIETYDAETRRARILPALRLLMTDGEVMPRALAINVPILFPAGGGYTMSFNLVAGDGVILMFSERGITEFKKTFELSNPDKTRLFDESDAVAMAGFGPLSITPASSTGATLQTNDGTKSVIVESDKVELRCGSSYFRVTESEIVMSAPAYRAL